MPSPIHYLVRVGRSDNFWNSSSKGIWGMKRKTFIKKAEKGDTLWFIKSGGVAIAVAELIGIRDRVLSNEELGWEGDGEWDIEILYENLYDIQRLSLNTQIKGQAVMRKYNPSGCKIDLITEHKNITRYACVRRA